jgi:bis(5'-nucleosyl)-tetraphosphatase (symmetrical)
MATYAIGDVQGCFEPLIRLVQTFAFNPSCDTLWFVGDVVNRGPDSLSVLRWVKALPHKVMVLGNHDLHLLAAKANPNLLKPQDTLNDILGAPDCSQLCAWLAQQPLIHFDPHLGYAMVHAGIPPQWNLAMAMEYAQEVSTQLHSFETNAFLSHLYGNEPRLWSDDLQGFDRWRYTVNALTRMRFCSHEGELDFANKSSQTTNENFQPWFSFTNRKTKNDRIIFGHWAALMGKLHEPNVIGLDTGCVWGNQLTAMRLEDGKFFSVPALSNSAA